MKIRILAITDEGIFRAGCIRRSQEGDLYYEPDLPGSTDYHLSRHKSGQTHWRSHKLKDTVQGSMKIPIDEIVIEQVLATGLENMTSPITNKPYVDNIADGVFAVDQRNLQPGHPNLFVWLVSPPHLQQLFDQHKAFPSVDAHQYYIYTGVEPWLVLSVVVIAPDPP